MWTFCLTFLGCSFFLVVCLPAQGIREEGDDDVETIKVSVVLNSKNDLEIKDGIVKPFVAYAAFKNSVNQTGWSMLILSTNGSFDDELQAHAAGMAEGYISADHIMMYFNATAAGYCAADSAFCTTLQNYIDTNDKWIQDNLKSNKNDPYWKHVNLVNKQIEGMVSGYEASKMMPAMSLFDFKLLNLFGDLEDLEQALKKKNLKKVLGSGSCSALIKLFPNNAELAISHVTWNDFNAMLRIYKRYNMSLHSHPEQESGVIPGHLQSFSSYPGVVYSGDDFYILSSGLVTQETTIGNSNNDLWKHVVPQTVFEFVRTVVANRLAPTGGRWAELFERHNSGTYNNQWMILNYNLFTPGKPLQPDTLWILEQLPGTVHMADMTMFLVDHGYWPSFNVPYFPYIYNISGVTAAKEKYGSWFDYDLNPRSQIFKRDHEKVVDMQTLVKLMRYNDFKNDPIAKCNCTPPYSGENAISARSDLNPANGTYPFGALGHRRHGGTDCKATNSRMAQTFSQFIVAGPTFDQQPPFKWSDTEWKKPLGLPDEFKFEPALLDWNLEEWAQEPF